MDYKKMSDEIISNVGGLDNIANVTHCATRFRLVLLDDSKVNEEAVTSIDGVMGIVRLGNQCQIIIGKEVTEVYKAFLAEHTDFKPIKKKIELKNIFPAIGDLLGAAIGPAIIPMVGGGIIKSILIMLASTGVMSNTSDVYTVLYFAADACWYFLPILLAYGTAKKLDADVMMSIIISCIMISPTYVEAIASGQSYTVFGLNIPLITYAGSFLPIIFTIVIYAQVEKILKKYIPNIVQIILVPTLSILIMTPIALMVTGPIITWLNNLLSIPAVALSDYLIIIVPLLSVIWPLLIMFGLHQGIFQVLFFAYFSTMGYDPVAMVSFLCAHIAIGTVAIATGLKSKDSKIKEVGFATGITMLVGNISEPAIFGILIRNKVCLISACIASGVAGIYAGITGIKCYVLAGATWGFIPTFVGEESSMFNVVMTCVISTVVSAVLIWRFYKDPKDKVQI